MPAVANRHLQQVVELQRFMVPVRELEAGPEWLVPCIGAHSGNAVGQRTEVPFQAGAEGFGDTHREAHGRNVQERLAVGAPHVDVHHLPAGERRARPGKVAWNFQGAGKVVGRSQRKDAQHGSGPGEPAGGEGHRPVTAANNHKIVPAGNHPVQDSGQLGAGEHMVHA